MKAYRAGIAALVLGALGIVACGQGGDEGTESARPAGASNGGVGKTEEAVVCTSPCAAGQYKLTSFGSVCTTGTCPSGTPGTQQICDGETFSCSICSSDGGVKWNQIGHQVGDTPYLSGRITVCHQYTDVVVYDSGCVLGGNACLPRLAIVS